MVFEPIHVDRLIATMQEHDDAGIVSGFYIKRDGTLTPLIGWLDDEEEYELKPHKECLETLRDNRGKLIECDIVPTGFMVIHRDVFKDLEKPYFEVMHSPKGQFWSSDTVFCKKVRDLGKKVYCHLGIEIDHLGDFAWTPTHFYNSIENTLAGLELAEIKNIALMTYEVNSREYWDYIWKNEDKLGFLRDYRSLYNGMASHITNDSKVLDIGSGVGVFADALHEVGNCDVTCVDISQYAVDKCLDRGFDAIKLDVDSGLLPSKFKNQFDYVVSTELIEHLETPEKLFKLARFALKPGGILIVSCPDNCLGPMEEPEHKRLIEVTDMVEYLSIFKDIQVGKIKHFLVGFGTK